MRPERRETLAGRTRYEKTFYASFPGRECPGCGKAIQIGDTVALPPRGSRDITWHWSCWEAEHRPNSATPPVPAGPAPNINPPVASNAPSSSPSTLQSRAGKNDYLHCLVTFRGHSSGLDPEIEVQLHVTHELSFGFEETPESGKEVDGLRSLTVTRTMELWRQARRAVTEGRP